MKINLSRKKSFLVGLSACVLFCTSIVSSATSLSDITDPGAFNTPWGGCGPMDVNCYPSTSSGQTKVAVVKPTIITKTVTAPISEKSLISALRSLLVNGSLPNDILEKLKGPKGDSGNSSVSVVQANPTTYFPGGTLMSATDLSSNNFITENARVTTLSVTGNSNLTGALNVGGTTTTNGLTVSGATTLSNSFSQTGANTFSTGTGAVSLNGATTINNSLLSTGQVSFTRAPSLAHSFTTWPAGTSNISDSTLYINPTSAVADSNLFGIAVNGTPKLIVDAEGDLYASNIILSGSVSSASTSIAGNLSVQDNTTLGDAPTDTTTVNGNTTLNTTYGSEMAPSISDGNWTLSTGWQSPISGGILYHNATGLGAISPTVGLSIVVGTTYKVTITTGNQITSGGEFRWSLGGITGTIITTANTTYTDYITARTTDDLTIAPNTESMYGKIASISIIPLSNGGNLTAEGSLTTYKPATFGGPINLSRGSTIYKDSSLFIHNPYVPNTYGRNLFFGLGSGNTTMSKTTNLFDASGNLGIGDSTLAALTSGYYNTAIGIGSLPKATTSSWRTAVGYSALANTTSGQDDTAVGAQALHALTTGQDNTAIGTTTLRYLTTGRGNVALGWWAGRGDLGVYDSSNESSVIDDYSMFLGHLASRDGSISNATKLTNATAIGYRAKVGASNAMVLGGTGSYAVDVGIGTIAPSAKLDVVGAIKGTSLALGGATIGTNTLAVTGTSALNSSVRISNPTSDAIGFGGYSYDAKLSVNGGAKISSDVGETLIQNNAVYSPHNDTTLYRNNVLAIQNTGSGNTPNPSAIRFLNQTGEEMGAIGYSNDSTWAPFASSMFISASQPYYPGNSPTAPVRLALIQEGLYSGTARYAPRLEFNADWTTYFKDPLGNVNLSIVPSTGNVGIGTTTPSQKLEVNGNILLPNGNWVGFKNSSGVAGASIFVDGSNNTTWKMASGGDHIFQDSGGNEWMRIKQTTGNVGIGTTTPGAKLDVSGNINSTGLRIATEPAASSAIISLGTTPSLPTSGAYIAINQPTGGTADFFNFRTNAVAKATLSSSGVLYLSSDGVSSNTGVYAYNSSASAWVKTAQTGTTISRNIADTNPALIIQQVHASSTGDILQLKNDATTVGYFTRTGLQVLQGADTSGLDDLTINPTAKTSGNLLNLKINGTSMARIDYNGSLVAVGIYSSNGLMNQTSANNSKILPSTTGTQITRNIADANPSLVIQQVHATSTGDILQLKNDASTVFTVQRGGNIGIGTTTPSQKLDIVGGNISIKQSTDTGANGLFIYPSDFASAGVIRRNSGDAGAMVFRNNAADTMAILNGNVGIGTTTPSASLHIYNASGISSLRVDNGVSTDSYGGSQLQFFASGSSAPANQKNFSILNINHTSSGNSLSIQSRNDDGTFKSDLITIANSGNIGIGTTSPGYKLHIYNASATVEAKIESDSGSAYFDIDRSSTGYTGTVLYKTAGADKFSVGLAPDSTDNFYIGDGGFVNKYLTINSGNVGIGTTSPSNKLDVALSASSTDGVNIIGNPTVYGTLKLSRLLTTPVGGSAGLGVINFQGTYNTSSTLATGAYIKSKATADWSATGYPSSLIFATSGASETTPVDRVIINDLGNVGIGTMSPGAKLDVSGNINSTGLRIATEPATSTGIISLGTTPSLPTVGAYIAANQPISGTADFINYRSNGVEKFKVYSSGDVQASEIYAKLRGSVANSGADNNALINMATTGVTISRNVADASPTLIVQQVNAASTGDILQLKNNSTTVGIFSRTGAGTLSSLALGGATIGTNALAVTGTGVISSQLSVNGRANSGTWGISVNGGITMQNSSYLDWEGGNARIRENSYALEFSTYTGAGLNTALNILGNGNVGVGITSPTANFQVAQKTTGIGTVSNTAGGTTVTGVGTQFLNTFKVGDTITIGGQTVTISAIASNTSMTTDAITNANTNVAYTLAGGTRFSVLGNGSVGIGTTTPASGVKLEVFDSTNPKISVNQGTGTGIFSSTSTDVYVGSATNSPLNIVQNGATKMYINTSGQVGIGMTNPTYALQLNGQPAANGYTAWTNYSDARLKENITDLIINSSNALEKIKLLRPVTYNYNSLTGYDEATRSRRISGFIAQELQNVFPEMVGEVKINGETYLDTNLSDLPLYMVKAIQELDLKLEEIISPTPVAESFGEKFLNNIYSKIKTLLADAGNGIESIFTKEIHTEKICVKKSDGTEFCADGNQLEQAVNNLSNSNYSASIQETIPVTEITPVTETTPTPEATSSTEVVPETTTTEATITTPENIIETIPEATQISE